MVLGLCLASEVDDGVFPSMAAFFTSFDASLVGSLGWTMVSELKLCFTPFSCFACSFSIPVS